MVTEAMKKRVEDLGQEKEVVAGNGKASKVEMVSSAFVKPGKKVIGRRECQLITFDLPYLAFFYNQKLMLYQGGERFEETVERMKEGLATVLEEFYQLAGKLGKDEEGIFRVEYDDEEEEGEGGSRGVEVLEAVGAEIGVNDVLVEEGTGGIMKDLLPYNGVLNLEGLHKPLLAIQFTKLKDGIALGCAFNHAILDGTSTWHFMSSWAEICRGAQTISAQPFLDRVKARNTKVKLDLALPTAQTEAQSGPKLREKLFKFSESAVDAIKSKVNARVDPTKPDATTFTTFQSITAHIWAHVTRARRLKPEEVTAFAIFADCRKRIDPPVPETYFGNMIQAIFTGTAAGLLLAHPLDFGAGVIQAAIKAHDAKMIDARNEAWEKSPIIFQYKDAGANCIAVGSSPRFKVYDIDFGFGRPVMVRSGANNRFDGMVYLYPGKEGGRSIDVEISLEESAMAELEKDEEFLVIKN
uniref:BAHD acyltransferase DCR n=1 Tax=Kalanchoe fedtschenkoi TaxID=63787 RepID=A0A7N0U8J4_KALFE